MKKLITIYNSSFVIRQLKPSAGFMAVTVKSNTIVKRTKIYKHTLHLAIMFNLNPSLVFFFSWNNGKLWRDATFIALLRYKWFTI